ncbi:MAG: ABC transporter ATP-binding protein [Verrucomicrobia bacterium]|nr:ABC transporter ATP-binding protein [Verrucomicrobiota bacterium]
MATPHPQSSTDGLEHRTARRLFGLLRPHASAIALALVCILFASIINGLLPFLVISTAHTPMIANGETAKSEGLDSKLDVFRRIAGQFTDISHQPITFIIITVIVYFALKGLFNYLQAVLIEQVGIRAVRDVRNRLFGHALRLSADFYTRSRTGDLISRTTNDIQLVQEALVRTFSDLFQQPFNLVVTIAVAFWIDWRLALIAIVAIPTVLFPLLTIGRRIRRRTRRVQEKLGDLTSILQETFQGIRVVKAFNMEPYETDRFERENSRLYGLSVRIVRQLHIVRPVIELLGGMTIAAALVIGSGVFGLGLAAILGFATAIVQMYEPAKKLGALYNKVQMSLGAAQRVFDVLDMAPSVAERPDAGVLPPIRDRISYENVSFAYEDEPVLRNVSISIRRGEVLAIVGPSGSGKTSMVNLLLRFYDPSEGAIRIDGTDLREVTLASLREQIGLVTQDIVLFNDTVAANIAYGRPDTPLEAIVEAAKAANAHDFVRALPAGYDTVIGERGVKLSGGQKQRLAIARALLRNPPILVLDEATSALDTESERLVQQAIDRLMRDRTALVIAHRLSTIQHADTIVVLSEGRIVEKGTHPDLVEAGGLYRRLYEMQFAL